MGCVQSYFKRAHNAGISPSSTQESNSKQPVSDDGTRPAQEERSITEEPESNDTSYGVEATAVRTLAATTGTVAILGTTAKTGDKKGEDGEDRKSANSASPAVVETIPEEHEEVTFNIEKAVVHEEEKVDEKKDEAKIEEATHDVKEESGEEPISKPSPAESRPSSNQVEEVSEKEETKLDLDKIPSSASTDVKEDISSNTSPADSKNTPVSDLNKNETLSLNTKSPLVTNEESELKRSEDNPSDPVVSESVKEKEDDASKSISSERLKTNSISNTTLSSDSIVEFENNSVKQSPSADKVIESFDSSSTVEFVDVATKDSTKEDNKTNPARSISSDLSNKANLPLDGEKTPDVLLPEEREKKISEEDLPPPPPSLEVEKPEHTSVNNTTPNGKSPENEEISELGSKPSIENHSQANGSLSDNIQNDTALSNLEMSSNETSSVQSVVKQDLNVQEITSKSTVSDNSPNASDDNNKAETGSPFSSDNNSSFNGNGEAPSPVTAVSLTPAAVSQQLTENDKGASKVENAPESTTEVTQSNNEKLKSDQTDTNSMAVENHKPEPKRPIMLKDETTKDKPENKNEEVRLEKAESIVRESTKSTAKLTNGVSSTAGSPSENESEKSQKAEIIVGTQNTNIENKNNLDNVVNGLSLGKSEDVFDLPIDLSDKKVVAAATTIQASFRGFQTRQNIKSSDQSNNENKKLESNNVEIDVNKSNVVLEKSTKANELESHNVEIDVNKTNVVLETSAKANELFTGAKSIEPDSILEKFDDQMIAAATTIQSNFRGFQTRQTLKSKVDSGLVPSEETNNSIERKTPTALTPELIESVKEEVNDICNEAEVIVAERSESVEGMLRGVDHVTVGTKESALPSVSDSIMAVRGSTTPPSVSEVVDMDEAKEEVFDSLTDMDDKTINAATTIQATFRGYQARKALQTDSEQPDSMPDYPPPDEYLQSLEDLPPPDFEALESSYSEDVPTEPLVPPPPPDSEIFNEEDEDELATLQRPTECDELPEHRLTLDTDSELSDSSLSSAATKIQAGVRGYLTRKQIQTQGGTGTGTTSTSTNRTAPDSDGSLSVDGVRSAISTEEESEVTRHRASPDTEGDADKANRPSRAAMKRMSLAEPPLRSHAPIRSRALSVQVAGPVISDNEVWNTLKSEMADAATKIQSNFRGYRARKQLQREDAVQGTSSSSQATPTPTSGSVEASAPPRTSGEYHDVIALTPPNVNHQSGEGEASAAGSGEGPVADQPADAMVKRRASDEDAEAAAATKIQATFRGFKTRQEMRDVDRAAAKIQAGFRGYKVRKEMKRNGEGAVRRTSNPEGAERSGSLDTDTAATKIQAGVRGFLVRRRVQRGKSPLPPATNTTNQ